MSFTSITLRTRNILLATHSEGFKVLPKSDAMNAPVEGPPFWKRPGPVGMEGEVPVYEVSGIVDKKIEDGKTLYRIRWYEYPDTEDSWEHLNITEQEEALHKDPDGKFYPRPPPFTWDLDRVPRYIVRRILTYAAPNGLVQWDGYPVWESTWEDISEIPEAHIMALISSCCTSRSVYKPGSSPRQPSSTVTE
ncbi:hypothetical protein BDN72DRAFT_904125 [Pluteus cervinus]|uniref:Uncharacterized protein n=1 Tax=Pluteus cervinus TaxID=181527 RepID=A0ACD3A7Y1_9AGAR|nr:hypothetical protein BDN72DRAFT_904125 [Pluteus cervinus]